MVGKDNLTSDLDPEKAKKIIKELHDKYHPEAIFVTQTGATLYGWAIREIYKEAWQNERVPKIFTIDIHPMKNRDKQTHSDEPTSLRVDKTGDEFKRIESLVESKLKSYGITGDVAIVDETRGFKASKRGELWLKSRFPGLEYPVFEPKHGV